MFDWVGVVTGKTHVEISRVLTMSQETQFVELKFLNPGVMFFDFFAF